MASLPTQRSLKHLRENGWTVCIVEKYIKHPGMPFGKRIDAFGFGDLLACLPYKKGAVIPASVKIGFDMYDRREVLQHATIALVQTTSGSNLSAHRAKILAIPEFAQWKAAGGIVLLHGWSLRSKNGRGSRKVWTLREEVL